MAAFRPSFGAWRVASKSRLLLRELHDNSGRPWYMSNTGPLPPLRQPANGSSVSDDGVIRYYQEENKLYYAVETEQQSPRGSSPSPRGSIDQNGEGEYTTKEASICWILLAQFAHSRAGQFLNIAFLVFVVSDDLILLHQHQPAGLCPCTGPATSYCKVV